MRVLLAVMPPTAWLSTRGLAGRGVLASVPALLALAATTARGQAVQEAWPTAGPGSPTAAAAAPLAGYFALADSSADRVEIRDVNQSLLATITRTQIATLCPWMSLDASQDGPDALAFSDSGRLLFIAVHDANAASDGLGSDAVLRYDTQTGDLTVFARLEISGTDALARAPSLAFFRGRLYVGLTGAIRCYRAGANDRLNATLLFTSSPATAAGRMVEGLAVDRLTGTLYAAWNNTVQRSAIGTSSLSFTQVGTLPGARALAWSDHFGAAGLNGLYALNSSDSPAPAATVYLITPGAARGTSLFAYTPYTTAGAEWRGLAATADGRLLASAAAGGVAVRDSRDARLGYSAWMLDEFAQQVRLARGLISPDGEPPGWVIDADVIPAWSRFHPATPDAAAWAVLVLLMQDYLFNDPQAVADVRLILTRYAGLHPDGIKPSRSADGIFRHWIDPYTGGVKPGGWDPEYATLSTMLIGIAAARARAFYPGDQAIADAASAILCGVKNWDAYINPVSLSLYYKSQAGGGPDTSVAGSPFMEGILFVEQAARYGGPSSVDAYNAWIVRGLWPSASYVTGRAITGDSFGNFQPAFISLYPLLTSADFRGRSDWRTQIANVRLSHMAWTDDNGPVWNTVFSAGTTKDIWGGYHADAISNSPGNVTTFTALLGLCAGTGAAGTGFSPAAVGAYQAYRVGARETFKTGASLLYRRSSIDPAYLPNSAGLADVTMGALGLAELIRPGSVAAVLTGAYPRCDAPACVADYNRDGFLNLDDLGDFISDFYITPAVPGREQTAAPTYPGVAAGFGAPCANAPDAPGPYAVDAYRQQGYRVAYSPDASNDCPLTPDQSFPNLDHLADYLTAYYAAFSSQACP